MDLWAIKPRHLKLNVISIFKMIALLFLVQCTISYSSAQELDICIKSDETAACQQQNTNFSYTTSNLSDLPLLLDKYLTYTQILRVYLTSGSYSLATNINFTGLDVVQIHGSSTEKTSIQCTNHYTQIIYDGKENGTILVANIILQHRRTLFVLPSLYFSTYKLSNISVSGLDAYNCHQLLIQNCHFATTVRISTTVSNITITNTTFSNYYNTYYTLGIFLSQKEAIIKIDRCKFENYAFVTTLAYPSHAVHADISITNSLFTRCRGYHHALHIHVPSNNSVSIQNTNFTNNTGGGLTIKSTHVQLHSCIIANNNGIGLLVPLYEASTTSNINISHSLFSRNKKAVELSIKTNGYTIIQDTHFTSNVISSESRDMAAVSVTYLFETIQNRNKVVISNSTFTQHHGNNGKCSTLYTSHITKLLFENLSFFNNNCTGVTLVASQVTVSNVVNMTNNTGIQGGALQLLPDDASFIDITDITGLIMTSTAQLHMINNHAKHLGGAIFTYQKNYQCCFEVTSLQTYFFFSGNVADMGGDAVFGRCLSSCSLDINHTRYYINATESNNIFWDLVSSENTQSVSTFVDRPNKVVFCDNTIHNNTYTYCTNNDTRNVTAFRGQLFNVSLMTVDISCRPSAADYYVRGGTSEDGNTISTKLCSSYNFYVNNSNPEENETTVYFSSRKNGRNFIFIKVNLLECPPGYILNSDTGLCSCNKVLTNYSISCHNNYSLTIPAQTWIGKWHDATHIVQKYCRYCQTTPTQINYNDWETSDKLCPHNRGGVMCSRCHENYSLYLSGDICGDCSAHSTLRGTLWSIAFLTFGIILIILLLTLNLTVSSGIINALIFYSNIVYLNHNDFLPIGTNTTDTSVPLQNTVRFLSAFYAWMNLDFGVSTCFVHNYDEYIRTWLQFTYPIYIWLLILLIVIASRCSRRLSKLTAPNIVPVLATLLLLSYTKLLTNSAKAAAFTKLEIINKKKNGFIHFRVWLLDGNIQYLKSKHLPLFLMSFLMTVIYIIPFTLLLLFGPLLQARSDYRILSWINKLKPLLDAFYGPYTSRYRYWPGILLIARMFSFGLFTWYALGDGASELVAVSVTILGLLVIWCIISHNSSVSPYQKKYLNYIELFILFNLGIFSILSEILSRHIGTKHLFRNQILAVAMAGSTFLVFCGIVVYQALPAKLITKIKALVKICARTCSRKKRTHTEGGNAATKGKEETKDNCTHSTLTVSGNTQSFELRERLLSEH